jgi:hypothetical protein
LFVVVWVDDDIADEGAGEAAEDRVGVVELEVAMGIYDLSG